MDKRFVLGPRLVTLAPGVRIVRRDELAVLYAADEILKEAQAAARQRSEEAQQAYERRYAEGYAAGEEAGKSEYSLKILEMITTQLDSLEGLEQQLTEVVIASVQKLIGSFDKTELAVRIVSKALAAVRGEKRVLVRVSLADEAAVRAELKPYLLSADGSSGYIEVRGDSSLGSGGCILETSLGVVEASLDSQLTLLQNHLRERVGAEHGA